MGQRIFSISIHFLLLHVSLCIYSQDSITKSPISLSGYSEIYYCYDFSEPASKLRPSFFYSHNRHNEPTLNLGFLKASYSRHAIRGNVAFMVGTYPQYNLATEPVFAKNILEANAGIKIAKKSKLWLDAGILPSHIGFESAIGKDCWNLTRSILADNSPYYETGLRLSATSENEKIYFSLLVLNGWQRIKPTNSRAAFGTQLTLKPKSSVTLNWSTFAGNIYPDSVARWRYFNNVYGQFQLTKRIRLITGFDIGYEQQTKNSNSFYNWYSPVMIVQYKLTQKLILAARAELYSDSNQIIVITGTKNGFRTYGYSLNIDYYVNQNLAIRLEGRSLKSQDPIFRSGSNMARVNHFIATSLCLSF
jgi:hypothetical protein